MLVLVNYVVLAKKRARAFLVALAAYFEIFAFLVFHVVPGNLVLVVPAYLQEDLAVVGALASLRRVALVSVVVLVFLAVLPAFHWVALLVVLGFEVDLAFYLEVLLLHQVVLALHQGLLVNQVALAFHQMVLAYEQVALD